MATEKSTELSPISAEVNKIKDLYSRLGPTRRFFFPSVIKKAIDQNESDDKIADAITRGTWFIHRQFFPELALFKLSVEPYENIEVRVKNITVFYQSLNSFRKFFFPRSFKELMVEGKNPSALEIASALHKGTLFYHKFFFPSKLGGYFTSRNAESTRWLFDPEGIPATEVGKGIENNLNELEDEYGSTEEVNTRIDQIRSYFNKRFFIKFIIPGELRTLLENKDATEPNQKIRLTLAVFGLPWYYKLLLNIFYPSMLKNFRKSEEIKTFYTQIQKSTILKGDLRVKRNIKTLADIAKKAREANKSPEEVQIKFSETLDYDMANLISSLNHHGDFKRNLNAQIALDLIRIFGDARVEKNDILYLCDALTLYFKNYPENDGNERLKTLVESFKTHDNFLALYTYLRQDSIGLFGAADTALNRNNLDAIQKILQKGDALITFELLSRHNLISKNNPHRQDNFEIFIKFQANKSNQLSTLNTQLLKLEKALATLHPDYRIEQTLYDFFMATLGTTIPLIDRVLAILTLMSQSEDAAFKGQAYPLLLDALKARRSLGSESLSEYLTRLEVAISALDEQGELNTPHLKLLLAESANPIQIKDEILASIRPPAMAKSAPPPRPTPDRRVEASTPFGVFQGIIGAILPASSTPSPRQQPPVIDPYVLAESGGLLAEADEGIGPAPIVRAKKAPSVAPSTSQVSPAHQQVRNYVAPAVLGFSATYAGTYTLPVVYSFFYDRTALIGIGLAGAALAAGYTNTGNTLRYTAAVQDTHRLARDVLPGGAPAHQQSQLSAAYQQMRNYAAPVLGFSVTYAGACVLPVVYSLFADRAGLIGMGMAGAALAIGYANAGDITGYTARVPANISNYVQQNIRLLMSRGRGVAQPNNEPMMIPPPPPPAVYGYYNPEPVREAILDPIEDAPDDHHQQVRELPAAPQAGGFWGLSAQDLNGYYVYARYAGAAAATLGSAYALYQDPTNTLLVLASYAAPQLDVTGGINYVRNFNFFTSAASKAGSPETTQEIPRHNI